MPTEVEPRRSPPGPDEVSSEPPDREERRVAALQRMFAGVLEDEKRIGATALRQIDRAVRGDQADE